MGYRVLSLAGLCNSVQRGIHVMIRHMDFGYPFWFRFLYLWMTYLIAAVGALLLVILKPMWITGLYTIALLIMAYAMDRCVLRKVPTQIQVTGNRVSLRRFGPYREFSLCDVTAANPNAAWPFAPFSGGWTMIRYRANSSAAAFYVAPYIERYVELVDLLSTSMETKRPAARIFTVTRYHLLYRWVGHVLMVAALLAFTLGPLAQYGTSLGLLSAIGVMWLLGILLIRSSRSLPTRVEFLDDELDFGFLFGGDRSVPRSEVAGMEHGGRVLGLRTTSAGITVRFKDRTSLYLSPSLIDFPELVCELQKVAGNTSGRDSL